ERGAVRRERGADSAWRVHDLGQPRAIEPAQILVMDDAVARTDLGLAAGHLGGIARQRDRAAAVEVAVDALGAGHGLYLADGAAHRVAQGECGLPAGLLGDPLPRGGK